MWSSVIDLIDLSPSRKEGRMSDKLDAYEITTVINALVGDTTPVGEEHIDKIKLENQKVLFEVTENLIWQICKNLKYMDRKEDSMFRIGYDAEKFLGYLVEEYELNNYVEWKKKKNVSF